MQRKKAAEDAANAAITKAKNDAKGPTDEKKKADNNLKAKEAKLPKGDKTDDYKKLRRLAKEANETVQKLKDCLEKCGAPPPPPPPGDGQVVEKPSLEEFNYTMPKLPDCFDDEAARKKFIEGASAIQTKVNKCIAALGQKGIQDAIDKGAWDKDTITKIRNKLTQCKSDQAALEKMLGKIDEMSGEEIQGDVHRVKICPKGDLKKSSKFMFPGFGYYSRPGGNTYTVTFTGDSTKWCTHDDGPGVPAPIAFADDDGNPTETYFDPNTGESAEFGPKEAPPPEWKKVIPTTDPKPRPGLANLGNQPELWVDPQTGRTKWVEVGGDYQPIDPPSGWRELVPRRELPLTETPKTAEAPPSKPAETPPPARTQDKPPQQPVTTTETPRTPQTPPPTTPDTPTPVTTTGAPPQIPDTVFVKATESVLRGEPSGSPLQGQTVKLLPPEKPDLPGSPATKTARDTGFDKPPAQCTTDANGDCRIDLPREERETYRLPTRPDRPKQSYRIDVDARERTGAVVETTGRRPKPDLTGTSPGLERTGEDFTIGNRTFTRIKSYADKGVSPSLRETFDKRDSNFEEDECRTKKPGPPLGLEPTSLGALNHELADVALKLDRRVRTGRTVR